MKVIGYIHICQREGWKKSFDILWEALTKYKLYDITEEIRCGVVNDDGVLIEDKRLEDPKIKIIKVGKSEEYERATLHHMREQSEKEDVLYYYLHTKGLRHFGKITEPHVLNWINMMLYFVVEKWKLAIYTLIKRDSNTYGCDYTYIKGNEHESGYAGNFWWAKSSHIKELIKDIPYLWNGTEYYNAPEHWVCSKKDKIYVAFQSGIQDYGRHYRYSVPEDKYRIL